MFSPFSAKCDGGSEAGQLLKVVFLTARLPADASESTFDGNANNYSLAKY